MVPRLTLLVVCFALSFHLTTPCRAQWYAPDTECHDRAQRRFVVELSRVLAWHQNRQNASGPQVAEVTYTVATSPEHRTSWSLHWLDAAGQTVREYTLDYPEETLATGPAWYREVARQSVRGARQWGHRDSQAALPPLTADALIADYWQGAESAATSRADSLVAAFALDPEKEPARLAGLLAQAALPSVSGAVSLDGTLLARAGAWLSLAELSTPNPAQAGFDALWSPILFLSGREYAAVDAWKKSPPATSGNATAKWWAFMLTRPTSRDVFAAAADPRYRRQALPMLVYEASLLHLGTLLDDVVGHLFGSEAAMEGCHDYGPFLQDETGIGGARMLEGRWPALSRDAMVKCFRQFKPEATDFHGYTEALARIDARKADAAAPDEPALAGWTAAAPLIDLGCQEGLGKLTPVGTVTSRDLLNFAWEMSGLQMGARWNFLANRFGDAEGADALATAALDAVEGSEVFFVYYPYEFNSQRPPEVWRHVNRPRLGSYDRLQELGSLQGLWAVPRRTFAKDQGENAVLWTRRCWLYPELIVYQGCQMFFGNRLDDIGPQLTQMHREGGPSVDNAEMSFFVRGLTATGVPKVKGSGELRLDLLKGQRETSADAVAMMQRFDPVAPFESGRRLEKAFWERPGSDMPFQDIFADYLRAHAYDSAKRFYAEAEPFLDERVGFSNQIGPRRFALAMLDNDREAMREALEASATGSAADIVMNMMFALSQNDDKTLERMTDAFHERYPNADPSKDMALKLKGFLALLPAFNNPADPDHGKALDYFGKYNQWPTLQWMYLQKAKLSAEDGVRFLGGKDTDPERRMMVAYLLRDKALFAKTYDDFDASVRNDPHGDKHWQNMAFVILHWLRNDLLEVPVPAGQTDLKPPGAETLLQAYAKAAGQ